MSSARAASSIYIGVVLLSLVPSAFSRPSSPRGSRFPAVGRNAREWERGLGCPGGFCPSFVSSSNYDLPHEYEPYVSIYTRLSSLRRRFSPRFRPIPLPLLLSASLFLPLSLAHSLPLSFSVPLAPLRSHSLPLPHTADVISRSVGLQMHPR